MERGSGPLETVVMLEPSFWQGRRVLVTGHTGFKGSWLSLWLCWLGAEVYGVALAPETDPALFDQLGLHSRIARHCLMDINDAKGLASYVQSCQPQVVIHLAAQPLVRRSYRDPLGTWATNVQGSLNLLEALKPLGQPGAA
jgi:CDP-glucose 4,6-dehydratase